jgi:hypothetical protein
VLEGAVTVIGDDPRSTLMGETGQRNDNVGVVVNETQVESSETKEGLNILHFPRLRPITDGFDFLLGHGKSIRR